MKYRKILSIFFTVAIFISSLGMVNADNIDEESPSGTEQGAEQASEVQEEETKKAPVFIDPDAEHDDVERFVIRLYQNTLGRLPEEEGFNDWCAKLKSKETDGARCAYGFVFSKEYLKKKTDDETYLTMLYTVFLDRKPDNTGMEYWLDILDSGMSREFVFRGFVMSVEFDGICKEYGIDHGNYESTYPRDKDINNTRFVQRLYKTALDRRSDDQGLDYWCKKLNDKTITYEKCAESFVNSKEFINKNLSDEEYIKTLYRMFLDREADETGMKEWLGKLDKGLTRNDLLLYFSYSPEFTEMISKLSPARKLDITTGGGVIWTMSMQQKGLLPDISKFKKDLLERGEKMLEAKTEYGFGKMVPENGYIDCSAFVTNLFRRTLGTMDVIDHWVDGGVCETDGMGKYFLYYGNGMQDLTNRGTWSQNNFTPGRYTSPGCGYLYIDKYGISSTDLMDCAQWYRYLNHCNVSYTLVNFEKNPNMKPIVYNSKDEVVSWGEWGFLTEFKAGDIVIWTDAEHKMVTGSGGNHIGVYLGNGKVLHSTSADYDQPDLPTTNRGVQVTSISKIKSYNQKDGKGSVYIYHIF